MEKRKVVKRKTEKNKKIITKTPNNSDTKYPIWLFTNIDKDGDFAFDTNRCDFQANDFIEKMILYSNMTWAAIKMQTHDNKGKSKHHHLSFERLSPAAQKRIRKLNLEEDSDTIFSFAFNNIVRIIGLKKEDKFFVLWYDSKHEVYPVSH